MHPKYTELSAKCICGMVLTINSVLKEGTSIDVRALCHPFYTYTGKQKTIDAGGRVERFRKRFGSTAKTMEVGGLKLQLVRPPYRFSLIPRRKSIWKLRRLLTVSILMSSLPLSLWAGPGAEIYNELLEKDLIYPDPEWQTYVSELGERLLNSIEGVEQTYTFTVVDQSLVNAWNS